MKIIKLNLILMLLLISCASIKKQGTERTGKIVIHKPYCGGAKPTYEASLGSTSPYANAMFYIKTSMNNDKKSATIAKIITDENGSFKVKLKAGSYVLIHEYKTLSLSEFTAKYNKPVNFQEFVGEKEAKMEYEKADVEFVVSENNFLEIIYKSKCFVGLNPLLKYTGPLPQ
jgi:hypothetical protein